MSAAATPGSLTASGLMASDDVTRDVKETLDREEGGRPTAGLPDH
jgi:hypothetical protein